MSGMIKVALSVGALFGMTFGGLQALDARYTPVSQWEQHLEGEQSRYVLELKKSIREIQARLRQSPDDPYLQDDLEDAIAALCELRPDDKLCK